MNKKQKTYELEFEKFLDLLDGVVLEQYIIARKAETAYLKEIHKSSYNVVSQPKNKRDVLK